MEINYKSLACFEEHGLELTDFTFADNEFLMRFVDLDFISKELKLSGFLYLFYTDAE